MASGVIHRLFKSGFMVIALEQSQPVCIRRLVCFANALYEKKVKVEGVQSVFVKDIDEALKTAEKKIVPVLVDPDVISIQVIVPVAVIDGRMLKKDAGSRMDFAPIVIGLGPGFEAGSNCHAVVETNRGFDLGRVIYNGKAEEYTGVPAEIDNLTIKRVLRAPTDGKFTSDYKISDVVESGNLIGEVNGEKIISKIDGVIRGLIHKSVVVKTGQKIGDIDPRGIKDFCFKISDKANAIGGGVLEALLCLSNKNENRI